MSMAFLSALLRDAGGGSPALGRALHECLKTGGLTRRRAAIEKSRQYGFDWPFRGAVPIWKGNHNSVYTFFFLKSLLVFRGERVPSIMGSS
jgi:hypothetical protein